jgi:hypothetical protein
LTEVLATPAASRRHVVINRLKAKKALAAIHPVGRRLLSFKEVIESGRPAVYSQFGDALLYMDGVLFDVLDPGSPAELWHKVPADDSRLASHTVGIEYGWRHVSGCSCDFCMRRARC